MSRKSQLQALANVLQSVLQNSKSPISQGFHKWRLWSRWPEIVGDDLAEYTDPVSFKNGVLTIWVKSSAHMQELIFFRDQLRDRINAKSGDLKVRKIFLTLDRKQVPRRDEASTKFKDFVENTRADSEVEEK